jgi:hypothetical protein
MNDTSMSGVLSAKLVQAYLAQKYLPEVSLDVTFWAAHTTDF